MPRRPRRAVLGLLAALAGCGGVGGPGASTPSDDSPADASPSPPASAAIRLEPTEVPAAGATVVVFPPDLRTWLRRAARSGDTLRVHATTDTAMPEPPLPAFDRIRLTDPSSDADGRYAVRAAGGVRYQYIAGAGAVTPPTDASVTPVDGLAGPRRRLALAAIADGAPEAARFYPETRLGEWARTEFFGGYVRHAGAVYRGREVQQTDAAFFSHECWYVLSLTPVSGDAGTELVLADVGGDVRRVIDDLLSRRNRGEAATRAAADVPRSVVRFVDRTDYLLTHAATFAATVASG